MYLLFVFVCFVLCIHARSSVVVMHISLFIRKQVIQLIRMRHFTRLANSFLFIGVSLVFVEAW